MYDMLAALAEYIFIALCDVATGPLCYYIALNQVSPDYLQTVLLERETYFPTGDYAPMSQLNVSGFVSYC